MEFDLRLQVNTVLNRVREAQPQFGQGFTDCASASEFCQLRLAGAQREEFLVLYLNSQHKLIKDVIEFKGTINAAAVYPREIARHALELNAAAVIISHNHPSGLCEPSQADENITQRIKQALNLFDIAVLDHIIVGNGTYSFAQRGKL
jgi:DNA repair protein RadC